MRTILLLAALGLGCATGYHPAGATGGFSELRLNDRAFEVAFRGNGYTSREQAQRLALRRAADLTVQSRFTHFVVDDQGSGSDVAAWADRKDVTVISRPLATMRFRMLTAQEAAGAPPGAAYEAATILAQFAVAK
jgi:hypothetical protein